MMMFIPDLGIRIFKNAPEPESGSSTLGICWVWYLWFLSISIADYARWLLLLYLPLLWRFYPLTTEAAGSVGCCVTCHLCVGHVHRQLKLPAVVVAVLPAISVSDMSMSTAGSGSCCCLCIPSSSRSRPSVTS
jgi:hypothetical protein